MIASRDSLLVVYDVPDNDDAERSIKTEVSALPASVNPVPSVVQEIEG